MDTVLRLASSKADSSAAWILSSSFRPPGLNSLTPLSDHGLCDAETMAPGVENRAEAQATAGVGATPMSMLGTPTELKPAANAAANSALDSRVSRPITTGPAGERIPGGSSSRR